MKEGIRFHHIHVDQSIYYLNLHIGVHPSEIMKNAVHVEFSRTDQDVFSGLLHLRDEEWVGLANLSESFKHLR